MVKALIYLVRHDEKLGASGRLPDSNLNNPILNELETTLMKTKILEWSVGDDIPQHGTEVS